jgi:hypothetical protein
LPINLIKPSNDVTPSGGFKMLHKGSAVIIDDGLIIIYK